MAGPLNATSSWTVPESWHTVPENGEEGDEEAAGGSDDEATAAAAAKKDRRKTLDPVKLAAQNQKYHVRVYRVNNSYHVVGLQLTSTVAQLLPELDRRLKIDTSREPHRLYLKERGRGRIDPLTHVTSVNQIHRTNAGSE
jgi:adenylate cyclase